MSIILYHSPGACSRVALNALEEIGVDFEDRPLALMRAEQKAPDYLAVNPKGKVPALVFDGQLVTENASILTFLAKTYPAAKLLPDTGNSAADMIGLTDLVWCSGTLHPLLRQILRPTLFSEDGAASARQIGMGAYAEAADQMSARFGDGSWWYGAAWSIVDVYLYWTYSTAALGGFPLADYPRLTSHAERVRSRASFQRALAREKAAVVAHDIPLPPGASIDTL